jgi:hypothetical protein
MRLTNTPAPSGGGRPLGLTMKRAVILIMCAVAGAWAVYGYAQEAYLTHRLGQQVSELRRQNALIAAQNQGYHKDITAITSGAANEEEARLNGYSRPREKLYLVTAMPSPTPASPAPSASPAPPKPTP